MLACARLAWQNSLRKIAPETNHRWRHHLQLEKTFSELCKRGLCGEPLYFLSFMILVHAASSSLATQLQTDPIPTPQPKEPTPDLMVFDLSHVSEELINSLRTPMRAKSVSYFHCIKRGILGIGTVQGFGPDWIDGRSIA
jgi:hypothetical protein